MDIAIHICTTWIDGPAWFIISVYHSEIDSDSSTSSPSSSLSAWRKLIKGFKVFSAQLMMTFSPHNVRKSWKADLFEDATVLNPISWSCTLLSAHSGQNFEPSRRFFIFDCLTPETYCSYAIKSHSKYVGNLWVPKISIKISVNLFKLPIDFLISLHCILLCDNDVQAWAVPQPIIAKANSRTSWLANAGWNLTILGSLP